MKRALQILSCRQKRSWLGEMSITHALLPILTVWIVTTSTGVNMPYVVVNERC